MVTRREKAQQRFHHINSQFFTAVILCYGSCAWDALGRAGLLGSRFTTLRTAASHSCGNECGSSLCQGARL
ncbi:hypothetical protein EMIT0P44_90055 [Pseudomonas sp. IT-P44]